jgi:hypothetical protein
MKNKKIIIISENDIKKLIQDYIDNNKRKVIRMCSQEINGVLKNFKNNNFDSIEEAREVLGIDEGETVAEFSKENYWWYAIDREAVNETIREIVTDKLISKYKVKFI